MGPTKEQAPPPDSAANEPEMVDVHEADIPSLDAALANAQEQEREEVPVQVADPEPTATPTPVSSATPGADLSKTAASQPPVEVRTADTTQGKPADDIAAQKPKGDQQKGLFIQHRSNELKALKGSNAEVRKQLLTRREILEKGLDDKFAESPGLALRDRDLIKEIDQELEGVDQREVRAERIVEAQTFFLQNVDTEKISVKDLGEVLRADGVDDRYVAQFEANPWEFTTPEALVQMGRRAMDRKELIAADSDRRLLAKHVLYLNSEIEKLRGKPTRVMNGVQKGLNQAPPVTAASNSSPKTVRDVDPTRMTIAELDQALKHATAH